MGGREKQLLLVLRAQSQFTNYDLRVLFQERGGPVYDAIGLLPGVATEHLPRSSEFSIRSIRACLRQIRASDIVLLHSPRIAFMVPLLLTREPLIYRLSGMFLTPITILPRPSPRRDSSADPGATSVLTGDRDNSPRKWISTPASIAVRIGRRLVRMLRWYLFLQIVTRRAGVVLVNSRFLADRAKEAYRVPRTKLREVRNGIDAAFEQARLDRAQPMREPDAIFTVCVVCRLDVRKRIDRLFEAIAPLVREKPLLRVLIAGNGSELAKLTALALQLNIADSVKFLGEVANPYDVLTSSNLFVLPSDNEAFSNSVLEAMFAGVPVAVFASGCGNAETICDRVDGFVVADVQQLRSLIIELMNDPEQGSRVGREGRRSLADKGLVLNRSVESLNDIIEATVSDRP